jgi:hypothetical protein
MSKPEETPGGFETAPERRKEVVGWASKQTRFVQHARRSAERVYDYWFVFSPPPDPHGHARKIKQAVEERRGILLGYWLDAEHGRSYALVSHVSRKGAREVKKSFGASEMIRLERADLNLELLLSASPGSQRKK